MGNNLVILSKAYGIDLEKIEDSLFIDDSDMFTYAETRGQAKMNLMSHVFDYDMKLRRNGEEVSYLTIPVVRKRRMDIVDFEGEPTKRNKIEKILKDREKDREKNRMLDEILADENIQFCYIKKGNYYRPNSCGYTSMRKDAGVYTKEEAVSEARCVEWCEAIPIDAAEHNKMIREEIESLKSRLIQ